MNDADSTELLSLFCSRMEMHLKDKRFRQNLRGTFGLQFVNGAGIQETGEPIPRRFVEWIRAGVETLKWFDREVTKAA